MLNTRFPALQSNGTHPATYILVPGPVETLNDDEVFTTDLDTTASLRPDLRKSCPMLNMTASRTLQRITEDLDVQKEASDAESELEQSCASPEAWNEGGLPVQSSMIVKGQISRKRSFLLADIIDDVEGRRPNKRGDNRQKSRDPHSMNSSEARSRSLRHQKSDFDVLYASARHSASSQDNPLRSSRKIFDQTSTLSDKKLEQHLDDTSPPIHRGRQRQLHSKKSLIAMSLERVRCTSPSKNRLDSMDLHHMTSFDALFDRYRGYKAEPAALEVSQDIAAVLALTAPLSTHKQRGNQSPARRDFTRNTRRLKRAPMEEHSERSRRCIKRQVASARDILNKYDNGNTSPRLIANPCKILQETTSINTLGRTNKPLEAKSQKIVSKEAHLRDSLRRLLKGQKKADPLAHKH